MENKHNPSQRNDTCQLYQLLDILGKKRVAFIIFLIKNGVTSFNQINNILPLMSGEILSDRLKLLQAKGLIRKEVTNTTPVHISYHVTELGEEIANHIQEIGKLVTPDHHFNS